MKQKTPEDWIQQAEKNKKTSLVGLTIGWILIALFLALIASAVVVGIIALWRIAFSI